MKMRLLLAASLVFLLLMVVCASPVITIIATEDCQNSHRVPSPHILGQKGLAHILSADMVERSSKLPLSTTEELAAWGHVSKRSGLEFVSSELRATLQWKYFENRKSSCHDCRRKRARRRNNIDRAIPNKFKRYSRCHRPVYPLLKFRIR